MTTKVELLLIRELLDSRIPKSEREHTAAREIERLREALAAMVDIDPEALMKVFKWTKVILVKGNNNAT
jgi:hypothetical protein